MYLLLDRLINIIMNCGNYDYNVIGVCLFNSLLEFKVNRNYLKYFIKVVNGIKLCLLLLYVM